MRRFWESERVRRHLPFAAVMAVVLMGLVLISMAHWRRGSFLIGCALLLAAGFRFFLPEERLGLLVLRRRNVDLALYVGFAIAIIAIAISIRRFPV
ncbi:hypothetical protein GCM10012275_32840 [Longimycelium tulufanense]|uniref:DUF3017 domain-containing protein n=1 Tax=Longimycelium tulufanense TaxID=907463 RepID=A0A8J3FUI9_9PSEU|nr:DUF3017 domain-containing protein [Longimycelium tulufanense]GGM59106.1 hypothetical protein GCM10012275_32840 [Longimycelium tulufanense]